jgi:cytosine/creatinine deaminase
VCSSLAAQAPEDLEESLALAARAGITIVSLPLVNEWTQDRSPTGTRTPRWRGVTALHEAAAAGVAVALASDNTRDQFYQYGDLDMLEVFNQGVRMAHLDRPIARWPAAVTATPAAAMHLGGSAGRILEGGTADLVLFRARRFSELLSRPQTDRVRAALAVCVTCYRKHSVSGAG